MTDTVKSWLEERRTIHAGGREVLLRSSYELERESCIEEGNDIDAIVDAHNNFPRTLDALNAVLELHKPKKRFPLKDGSWEMSCDGCDTHITFTMWPCKTVRAIEGAINE